MLQGYAWEALQSAFSTVSAARRLRPLSMRTTSTEEMGRERVHCRERKAV